MASHHTKDKGDLGVAMVICDLVCQGIYVYVPLSEHQPSDLIAMRRDGKMARVQVKYRSLERNGVVKIDFRNTYADRKGHHKKLADRSQFDCYAVYCPDNRKIYYVRIDDIPEANLIGIALRVVPPKNNQRKGVLLASEFESVHCIFD
jgi:hypothetical protein